MNLSSIYDFLRRELAPTPGRAGATLRLTLACLAATIPILTHRIPHGLIVMIVMYLITQEDTVATLIGSILGVIGVTIGLGMALLALEISMDIPWLRFCFIILYLFGGLFLKRVIAIEGLGSAIGIPAALAMMLPDVLSPNPDPETTVEFILWVWWCAILGMSVNLGVQLLLSPGDPLKLLRRELDTRLLSVEETLRRLAGKTVEPAVPLGSLAVAGMSRPLTLLKTASIKHRWARERHEKISAIITLTDRLVTSAIALERLSPSLSAQVSRERLVKTADGCERTRKAFQEMRVPSRENWTALESEQPLGATSPLRDIELTLDEIVLAVPQPPGDSDRPAADAASKFELFLPDAFENPEYVRFAIKGALAALICYISFIGFDYRGIYTSVITCFVVSLSTIGASNQKGLLRFGGAAVGGGMGLIALVYLFPNIETIGGFWLVFGAGTAVAAWVTYGSPRVWYGGYQIGLAFYKAVLQRFGPAFYLKVVRDRLVGVFFGLVVFGLVEHFLWPVRATDAMRERLAEIMRSLSGLVRARNDVTGQASTYSVADSSRRRISEKVQNLQTLIESSKFELGNIRPYEMQKLTGEAQIIFILLLTLTRQEHVVHTDVVRAEAVKLDNAIAEALLSLSTHIADGSRPTNHLLDEVMEALERYTTTCTNEFSIVLYQALVTAISLFSSRLQDAGEAKDQNEAIVVGT